MRRFTLIVFALLLAFGGAPAAWTAAAPETRSGCCGDACACGDTCPCGIERDPAPDRPAAPAAVVSLGGERVATPPDDGGHVVATPVRATPRLVASTGVPSGRSGRMLLVLKSVWRT
ncbi:MAG: hypothetical protein ACO3P9_04520 [Phycisphaerales bacterium]|jgi:hypothetical protein